MACNTNEVSSAVKAALPRATRNAAAKPSGFWPGRECTQRVDRAAVSMAAIMITATTTPITR